MEELYLLLNQYGSVASILGFFLIVLGFLKSQLTKFKLEKKYQEKIYEEIKGITKSLAENATTVTKRQDLFFFINETLSRRRHVELRLKFDLVALKIACIFFIPAIILALIFIKVGLLYTFVIMASLIFLVWGLAGLIRVHKIIEQQNDAFSEGYLGVIESHIFK